MNTVYIALGSNQNNPIYHVQKGIREINHLMHTKVLKKPDYINAVIKIQTDMDPEGLLDSLQRIENTHHRKRTKKWGPRTLDLDILIYNDLIISNDRLTIPHPEMVTREFVLIPLFEITSYRFSVPKYGKLVHYLKGSL